MLRSPFALFVRVLVLWVLLSGLLVVSGSSGSVEFGIALLVGVVGGAIWAHRSAST
jgi:hypothetical protein